MQTQTFPLATLALAPENARYDSEADISDLLASIPVVGLLDPLHGYREGDQVLIEDGGRRLRAVQHLAGSKAGRKVLATKGLGEGLPVIVREKGGAALRSLVTFVREPLHPADEILAIKAVMDSGATTTAEVAGALAMTAQRARQLMRLVGVAPAILAAFKEGRVSLDAVRAFSLTDDQDTQVAVLQSLGGLNPAPWAIKDRIANGALQPWSALARYVGREAYEAAGGGLLLDLFSQREEAGWTDAALAQRLADEKLAGEAEALRADGWQDVRPVAREDAFLSDGWRVEPEPRELSEAELAEWEAAEATCEDPEASEADREKAELTLARLDAAQVCWPDAVKAEAVAFLYVGSDGVSALSVWRAQEPAGDRGDDQGNDQGEAEPTATPPADPLAAARYGWTHGGHRRLTEVATTATRAAMIARPAAAADVLLATLAYRVVSGSTARGAVTLAPASEALWRARKELGVNGEAAYHAVLEKWSGALAGGFADVLAKVCALKPKERTELMALVAAASLDAVEAGLHGYERNPRAWAELATIGRHVGLNPADAWTPDADFLKAGSREALEGAAVDLGLNPAGFARKRDLAEAVATVAAEKGWTPRLLAELVADEDEAEPAAEAAAA